MKLFKNFKTKKQLREELEIIQMELMRKNSEPLRIVKRNVQKVSVKLNVPFEDRNMPEKYIKAEIARGILEQIQPLIEYDFEDDGRGGKNYWGSLYVGTK